MKRLYLKCKNILRDISALHIPVYSANAAFFVLLSLFPAAITLLSILQYLPATVRDLQNFIESMTPAPIHAMINDFTKGLSPASNVTVLSVSAAGTAWSITRAMVSIMNGLDVVYQAPRRRPLLKKWALGFGCALMFLACILATLLLQVFGGSFHEMALGGNHRKAGLIISVLQMRWPFTIGFLIFVFCIFYTILPCRRNNLSRNLPGAVLAAIGWLVYSSLFGFYVENFSNYSNVYGSLTVVIITMLWMYFCMNLIFYGGLFNFILAEVPHPIRQLRQYFRR